MKPLFSYTYYSISIFWEGCNPLKVPAKKLKKLWSFEFSKREFFENIITPLESQKHWISRSSVAPGPPDGADPSVST